MTDHELLEAAAKLLQSWQHPDFANFTIDEDFDGVTLELGSCRGAITTYWNPLTDDGDSFRLMVYLGQHQDPGHRWCFEGKDASATRREVVQRAADLWSRSGP